MPPAAKPRLYSKPALAAATGVTAFTLVLTGAIVGQLSSPTAAPEAAQVSTAQVAQEPAAPAVPPASAQAIQQQPGGQVLVAPPPVQPIQSVQQLPAPAAPVQPVQPIQPPAQPMLSQEQAVQIARGATGGSSVQEVRRRTEDGRPAFEVRFADDARATIDAITGRVLEARGGDRSGSGGSGRGGRG